jgi:hypothetical protein
MAIEPSDKVSKRPPMFRTFMGFCDLSLRAANIVYGVANLALIVGAVLILAGTIAAFWSGGIRERYGDARLSKNEADTAEAMASASAANERAEVAGAEAAKATQKTVEANVSLEQERIARLKLEERLADRDLTQAQRSDLAVQLKRIVPHKITMVFELEREPSHIAEQIKLILANLGWDVGIENGAGPSLVVSGIRIEADRAAAPMVYEAAQGLADALRSKQLQVIGPIAMGPVTLTGGVISAINVAEGAAIRLTVGSK